MEPLKAVILSGTFLFCLKTAATITTALFGIYGLGVKARDEFERLTRQGKTVLIGLITSATITGLIQVGEHIQKEHAATIQLEKSTSILRDVRRNLYVMRGMTTNFTISFNLDDAETKAYTRELASVFMNFSHDPECSKKLQEHVQGLSCDSLFSSPGERDVYQRIDIKRRSPLFPKLDSMLYKVLGSMEVRIRFYRRHIDPTTSISDNDLAAQFFVEVPAHIPADFTLAYNTAKDIFEFSLANQALQGYQDVIALSDLTNGSMAALGDIREYLICSKSSDAKCETGGILDSVLDRLRVRAEVNFPFAKQIRTTENFTKIMRRNASYFNIPDDLDKIDSLGYIRENASR
jgi:hypothetical protein